MTIVLTTHNRESVATGFVLLSEIVLTVLKLEYVLEFMTASMDI